VALADASLTTQANVSSVTLANVSPATAGHASSMTVAVQSHESRCQEPVVWRAQRLAIDITDNPALHHAHMGISTMRAFQQCVVVATAMQVFVHLKCPSSAELLIVNQILLRRQHASFLGVWMQTAVWQLGLVLQELDDQLEIVVSGLNLVDVIQRDGCKLGCGLA